MTDGAMGLMGYAATFFFMAGAKLERGRSMLTGKFPWYRTYRCSDGRYLSIGAVEARFWKVICEHFGKPEWIAKQYDEASQAEQHAFFEARFATQTRDAWFAELSPLAVCVAPVLDVKEAFESEHAKERGLVAEVGERERPAIKLLGIPIKLSATPGRVETPPAPLRRAHRRRPRRARPRAERDRRPPRQGRRELGAMTARAAAILAILFAASAFAEPPAYTVAIPPGIVLRHTAAEAVAAAGISATSVEAADGAELRRSGGFDGAGPIWIVRGVKPNGCVRTVTLDDDMLAVFALSSGGAKHCRGISTYIDVQKLQKAP